MTSLVLKLRQSSGFQLPRSLLYTSFRKASELCSPTRTQATSTQSSEVFRMNKSYMYCCLTILMRKWNIDIRVRGEWRWRDCFGKHWLQVLLELWERQSLSLYDEDEKPLNINFQLTDVQYGTKDDLPKLLHHPKNFRQVRRFCREWQGLGVVKQRIVRKAGRIFQSPLLIYEELKQNRNKPSKARFTSKQLINAAVKSHAEDVGADVTKVQRRGRPKTKSKKMLLHNQKDNAATNCWTGSKGKVTKNNGRNSSSSWYRM